MLMRACQRPSASWVMLPSLLLRFTVLRAFGFWVWVVLVSITGDAPLRNGGLAMTAWPALAVWVRHTTPAAGRCIGRYGRTGMWPVVCQVGTGSPCRRRHTGVSRGPALPYPALPCPCDVGRPSSSRMAGSSASLSQVVCRRHVEPVVAERLRYLPYCHGVDCALRESCSRFRREGAAVARLSVRVLGKAAPGCMDVEMRRDPVEKALVRGSASDEGTDAFGCVWEH